MLIVPINSCLLYALQTQVSPTIPQKLAVMMREQWLENGFGLDNIMVYL